VRVGDDVTIDPHGGPRRRSPVLRLARARGLRRSLHTLTIAPLSGVAGFHAGAPGHYVLQVTASDGVLTSTATVDVTVTAAPTGAGVVGTKLLLQDARTDPRRRKLTWTSAAWFLH
jgi:hypothetical protein